MEPILSSATASLITLVCISALRLRLFGVTVLPQLERIDCYEYVSLNTYASI